MAKDQGSQNEAEENQSPESGSCSLVTKSHLKQGQHPHQLDLISAVREAVEQCYHTGMKHDHTETSTAMILCAHILQRQYGMLAKAL